MKPTLKLILAAFGTLLVVSCYPYPEKQPQVRHRPDTVEQKKEAEKAAADKLKEKEAAELEKKKEDELKKEGEDGLTKKDGEKTLPEPNPKPDKPKGTEPRPQYDVAKKAPGKEGFVLSPYNNKLIDVRGIASGTLVQDPTYDASEKKYFRVP